jgi:hypothetical protein
MCYYGDAQVKFVIVRRVIWNGINPLLGSGRD